MTDKTFLLMMKVFHRSFDAAKKRTRLYAEAQGVMKKMPYIEQTFDDDEDVVRVYDPTIPFIEPRHRAGIA